MFKYTCLNPIAAIGLNNFTDGYEKTDNFADAQAVLVRSASMHDSELSDNLLAVARAGAGYNNIPVFIIKFSTCLAEVTVCMKSDLTIRFLILLTGMSLIRQNRLSNV